MAMSVLVILEKLGGPGLHGIFSGKWSGYIQNRTYASCSMSQAKQRRVLAKAEMPKCFGIIVNSMKRLRHISAIVRCVLVSYQVFFYSQSIFVNAKVPIDYIPYAVMATNAVNVVMTLVAVRL